MSGATKKGPCRIPTFGSRIPQIHSNPSAAAVREITATHVGKRVRAGDKEGILRFVGNVHFAKGTWCGIELNGPVGKNDGSVNGVRYFPCSHRCGLMAPHSKVALLDSSCESLSENSSGPYSMLFIEPKAASKNAYPLARAVSQEVLPGETTYTRPVGLKIQRNLTFELDKNSNDPQGASSKSEDRRDRKKLAETSKKRSNGTFDIPDPSSSTTKVDEDRGDGDINQNLSSLKGSRENLSSVEVKRRRTSNPKAKTKNEPTNPVTKPPSLLPLTPPELKSFCFSTPSLLEFKEPFLTKLRLSSIHADDENSKRDSLEFDESLGILTPDQMINSVQFPSAQTRTPSLEYDVNLDSFKSGRKSELPSPREESLDLAAELAKFNTPNIEITGKGGNEEPLSPRTDRGSCRTNELALPNLTLRFKSPNMEIPAARELKEEVLSPNLTDYSLGIIDDQILSNRTDTTMNMELPLDSVGRAVLTRLEQTPSPEELPLDPAPAVESDPKTEPSKSKTSNSFVTSITSITSLDTGYQGDGEMSRPATEHSKSKTSNSFVTSITSITSLDTGYQGDGEMSRPASRGADNSPLTRRPLPRPQTRRPDPMTDSDFYTESDADNHEENHLRGDRKAQVIDGTLYGVDPQAAADIYVNNRENMDSSGIFTDIEGNTRNEEAEEVPDVSPSDTSTKTISENSQNNLQDVLDKTIENKDKDKVKDNPKKRNAPSPGILSPSSLSSPRHGKEEGPAKKYKMPKRDVASKVKAMLEPGRVQANEKKPIKKPAGRWDAVMNKISKNDQSKTNLKDVKSKVFGEVNVNTAGVQRLGDLRKTASRTALNQKNPNNKICTTPVKRPGSSQSLPSSEKRRIRNRPNSGSSPKTIGGSNIESSIHSSLSDLSAATLPPSNKTLGSAKKRADVVQVTQVLTANKLSPRNQQHHTAAENKKNATLHASPTSEPKNRRTIFSPKEKKQTTIKECGRGTVKGGRTSPSVRPPAQTRVLVKQPPVAEALAVLVQHLVFNVEAYQVPNLRRQVEKYRLAAEEIRLSYQQLEESFAQEKIQHVRAIEEQREKRQRELAEVIEKHKNQIADLNSECAELEQRLRIEKDNAQHNLCKSHEEQLATLKKEFEKLQRTHEESLDILREENESIREQIDERRSEIADINEESKKLKEDYETREVILKKHYETREVALKEDNQKLQQRVGKLEADFEEQLKGLMEENKRLREENDRLLSYGDDKGIGVQEVQSLRAVLELKQNEVAELRRTLAEETHKAEMLVGAEEKARLLNARCEDLNLQLQRKAEYEKTLKEENRRLQENFKEETNHKRRLSQHNEELQWKLKQNKEVINKVLEQAEETVFNRSLLSSSFNERHSVSRPSLERTLSHRERYYSAKCSVSLEESIRSRKSKNSQEFDFEDPSPPTSPKVKGVVEKSDSVSYVLDMDESPEVKANRIVRRSFRNTTPPKNTPTKSHSNRRTRSRNPLSQSASSSAIISSNKNEFDRPRSAASRNGDYENDNVFPWSSSPKYDDHHDESYESSNSSMKLEEDHLDLDEDNEVDIELPALPSELNRRNGVQALPSPKHLAGEAMISESNSEDESTSSSQL